MDTKLEHFRIPIKDAERLEKWSKASGMSKTEIIIRAIRAQIANQTRAHLKERLIATDLLMMEEANSTIESEGKKLLEQGEKNIRSRKPRNET